MVSDNKLVRIGEAAEFLLVSTSTLRDWHRRGVLVPVVQRSTGHRLYSIAQLKEFHSKYKKVPN